MHGGRVDGDPRPSPEKGPSARLASYAARLVLTTGVLMGAAEPALSHQHTPAAPIVALASTPDKPPPAGGQRYIPVPRFIIYAANAPAGYVIKNIIDGNTVTRSGIVAKDHHKRTWEAVYIDHPGNEQDNGCAWALSKRVRKARAAKAIRVRYSRGICSQATLDWLADRDNIGEDFNCGPSICDDGSDRTRLKESCKDKPLPLNQNEAKMRAYNIIRSPDFEGKFRYRFRIQNKAIGRMVVRFYNKKGERSKKRSIWVMVPDRCVIGDKTAGPKLNYGDGPVTRYLFSDENYKILKVTQPAPNKVLEEIVS